MPSSVREEQEPVSLRPAGSTAGGISTGPPGRAQCRPGDLDRLVQLTVARYRLRTDSLVAFPRDK